jgi:tetratricopeptide (TPR) repeat protein
MLLMGPLRARDRDAVLAYIDTRMGSGRGGTCFLTGPPDRGGRTVLDAVQEALATRRDEIHVIRGHMVDGAFVPVPVAMDRGGLELAKDATTIASAFVAAFGLPAAVVQLVDKLISASMSARKLAADAARPGAAIANGDPVGALFQAASDDQPLVILIDELDGANAAWGSQLLWHWGPRTESQWRVVFVATLDGPATAAELSGSTLPPSLGAAVQLHERGYAEWHYLTPLDRQDVRAWLPKVDESVVDHLWTAGGGVPELVEALWQSWLEHGLLEERDAGEIGLVAEADVRAGLGLHELALERLRRLVPQAETNLFDVCSWVLHVGALEGESFTVEAVARSLPDSIRVPSNEIAEVLSRYLSVESVGTDALIERRSSDGEPTRYRFMSRALWLALRTHGFGARERKEVAERLAAALVDVYGADSAVVGSALVALNALSGHGETAAAWRLTIEAGNAEIMRWRAHLVLAANRDSFREGERELAARILVDAFELLFVRVPHEESAAYAATSTELVRDTSDTDLLARAYHHLSIASLNRRELGDAVTSAEHALACFESIADERQAARVALHLAIVYQTFLTAPLDPETATDVKGRRDMYLEQARRKGDAVCAGLASTELGIARFDDGDELAGLALLKEAVRLVPRQSTEAIHRTMALRYLAKVEIRDGDLGRARALIDEAVAIARDAEDLEKLNTGLHQSACVALGRGEFDEATRMFARCIEIAQEIQNHNIVPAHLVGLALSRALAGNSATAHQLLVAARRAAPDALQIVVSTANAHLLPSIAEALAGEQVGFSFSGDPSSAQRRSAYLASLPLV